MAKHTAKNGFQYDKLHIVFSHEERGQDSYEFYYNNSINGIPDSPYIRVFEARELTKKERKTLAKQTKSK